MVSISLFMSASIACSKLNGCSEMGFAFGMRPPLGDGVEHSSLDISPELASAAACSAFCDHIRKDVGILPVIMPIGKFSQIQWQIILADLMERTHYPALEQAPEAIQIRCMDVPAHIFTFGMIHGLMRVLMAQASIASMFIGSDQRYTISNSLPNKLAHGLPIGVLDDLANDIALPSNGPDHGDFPNWSMFAFPLAAMTIPLASAQIGFVHFHFPQQFRKASIFHRRTNAMAYIPGRLIGTAADQSLNLQGANALLALQHQIDHLKPYAEWIVRVLKNCFAYDREAIAVASTAILRLTDPMKRTARHSEHLPILTARAFHAIWPSALLEKLFAGLFRGEAAHSFSKCQSRFHDLTSLLLRSVYRFRDVVSSRI